MSPRGAESFTKHQAAVEQRRESAQDAFGPKADYFGLESGQVAIVRFLEQGEEIAYASVHRVPMAGRQYPQDMLCLDQNDDGTACPFCQSEFKGIRARSTKGFHNLIWRGGDMVTQINAAIYAQNQQRAAAGQPQMPYYTPAPVYKRNEFGSPEKGLDGNKIITGYADGVFLWKASKSVFTEIVNKDTTYRGIMSRDMTVRRQGSAKEDTKYFIEPYDVNSPGQPMMAADLALANGKYDLEKFITPPAYEDAMKVLNGQVTAPGPQPTFDRGGMVPPPGGLVPGVPMVPPGGQNPFAPGAPPMPASQPIASPPPGLTGIPQQ